MVERQTGLTAEDLVDLDIPGQVSLSPTAEQVIYSVTTIGKKGKHPVCSLWIAKVNEKNSARQITSGHRNDCKPQWSPDGNMIAFISDRKMQGETCAIYCMSVKEKKEKDEEESVDKAFPLTSEDSKRSITSFRWSPDGTAIAYISPDEKSGEQQSRDEAGDDVNVWGEKWEYNRLRVVDLSTRMTRTLYSDHAHAVNLTWNPDSKSIAFTTHRTTEVNAACYHGTDFKVASLIDSSIKSICHFPGPISLSLEWLGESLYFGANCRPSSLASACAIHKLAVDNGTWKRCYLGEINDAQGLKLSRDTLSVKVVSALQNEIHLMPDATVLYSDQQEILGHDSECNFDVATNLAGNLVVVLGKSSNSTPTEIYSAIYNGKQLNASALTTLSSHGRAIAALNIGTAQPLTCQSDDGNYTLDAMYVSPQKSSASHPRNPLPTAVLIHGGPYFHKTDSFDGLHLATPWAPMILATGKYGVLIPNYRGNSSYGEEFAAQAEGKTGTFEYDDILTLVDEGIKRGFIDKDRIIIGGWSQGGLLSYLAAVRNGRTYEGKSKGWSFKGVIPGAGVTDFDSYLTTTDAPYFGATVAGGAPWEKAKEDIGSRRGSALWEFAAGAKQLPPVLILHGELDRRVHINQAWGFHRACLSANVPCHLVTYPREPHFFTERRHLIDMLQRVRHFCDTHLNY